ncbi:ThuA domain-containing protein [Echinimonas agarilytica]|uniref:ThuA domain-containing protein n=1 Tax=Echinimonas agarilytica TaxID=1215918 RepID=A0AA41W3M8_9GAMM|nr:ThuA domain-containing protein [Echinimonas agarilytica]MCM2678216.1 ThuA domain-containing protein [Echinimonas agarilytica]
MTHKIALSAALTLTLLCSPQLLAQQFKLLIIDGQNNHQIWPKSTAMMKRNLEDSGLFKVDVERSHYTWRGEQYIKQHSLSLETVSTEQPVADPNFTPDFSDYDVVISNFGWKSSDWPTETQKAFEQYMKDGGGFVSVHAANNAFPNWQAYNKMIGVGGWGGRNEHSGPMIYLDKTGQVIRDNTKGKAGTHGEKGEFLIQLTEPHPITKGLPTQWLHSRDEIYGKLRGPAKNMTVLASAYSDPKARGTGRYEPVMMALTYGEGRVFHTTLGHDENAFDDVGFMTTLIRGAEWAASGAVTYPVPKDFPTQHNTSSRTFHSEEWVELLDLDLAQWDVFVGVPHTRVKGLPVGTPQADKPKEGVPLGLNNDPKNVVTVTEVDGKPQLNISGEIYAGITTRKYFENFHFSAEVKWGEKKWAPRENAKRDSGLLYHASGEHGRFWNVWKRCVEYQIQEGDFGDLFMLAGTGGTVRVKDLKQEKKWDPKHGWDPSMPYQRSGRVKRSENFEKPHGEWNLVEVYAVGQQAVHLVNGEPVLAIDEIRMNGNEPLTGGEIQLQSEGAEVYYRNVKIRNIEEIPEYLRNQTGL